ASVGIATRHRLVGIDDGRDPRRDKALGRDAIEVAVIDHRDVTLADPLGEILRARPDARDTGDAAGSPPPARPPEPAHVTSGPRAAARSTARRARARAGGRAP